MKYKDLLKLAFTEAYGRKDKTESGKFISTESRADKQEHAELAEDMMVHENAFGLNFMKNALVKKLLGENIASINEYVNKVGIDGQQDLALLAQQVEESIPVVSEILAYKSDKDRDLGLTNLEFTHPGTPERLNFFALRALEQTYGRGN